MNQSLENQGQQIRSGSSKLFLFVILGPEVPLYFYKNLEWIKRNFPDNRILVVFDEERHRGRFQQLDTLEFQYVRKHDANKLIGKLTHDFAFRNGFWQLTIDRLFAICDAMIDLAASQVIYVENDVLLLPNFPVDEVQKLDKLAWTRYNQVRDVPSVIFLPNAILAKTMRSELMNLFHENPNFTDMNALNSLALKRKDITCLLPTIIDGMENSWLLSQEEFYKVNKLLPNSKSDIQGIFDGAVIGMYLTGQDPNNFFGFSFYLNPELLHQGESYIDLNKVKFKLSEKRLFVLTRSLQRAEIFNLHIHSKNPEMFTDQVFSLLEDMTFRANLGTPYMKFKSKVLINLIVQNIRDGTFIGFFARMFYFLMRMIITRFMDKINFRG
jgi:hypothetical protein